jgi:hypothetical protein
MFVSKVDKEKHSDVKQEYRFEWIKDWLCEGVNKIWMD